MDMSTHTNHEHSEAEYKNWPKACNVSLVDNYVFGKCAMSGQLIGAGIMFLLTVGFAALFWLPALKVKQDCHIVKFYWMGFWAFLGGPGGFVRRAGCACYLGPRR